MSALFITVYRINESTHTAPAVRLRANGVNVDAEGNLLITIEEGKSQGFSAGLWRSFEVTKIPSYSSSLGCIAMHKGPRWRTWLR